MVADFEDQLINRELYSWDPIENGKGRQRAIRHMRTVIDVFEWSHVLQSARERNRALITMAGLSLRADTAFQTKVDAAE